ncbi:hypothetical protein [Pedobacter ginsengisoli]|uniref:hypothetical protein n=1 Tax=Pedobacter ginsengisoli TaxID=363852 RepID=UPI0025512A67|nr:hypothetical protein [Pedobacter ginsengisoli]
MLEELTVEEPIVELKRKPNYKKQPKRDDELWKGILEDVFEDFLRFFFPDADEIFNMEGKFSFMDKEFNRLFPPEENGVGVRYVDKLVKVHLKAGGSRFILVHIEVQGQKGVEDLGSRMFRYFYRAKDKHNVSITAFAILIDEVKSYHPKIYREEYLGTKLSYEFNTYKFLDQDEQELRENPNPFAVVALVVLLALKNKNVDDEALKQIKLDLTKELIKRKVSKSKHIKIMDFLAYYVNFQNPEMMIRFEEEVEQLTGRTTPMGVREILIDRAKNEGLERGRQEERAKAEDEKRELAREMLADGTPIDQVIKYTRLSKEEIEAL